MRIYQKEIKLKPRSRGFHLIDSEINSIIEISDIKVGFIHLFLKHTSASLTINENYDSDVRADLESFFSETCDNKPYFRHTLEGSDDMPAHIKSSLLGVSLTLPITNGRLNLGTWQGVYLNEHRDYASSRSLIITITGE
jgi:secondary thiamine-phosphate synthase enzyme